MRWVRLGILLLAFVEGGWLAYDGAHALPGRHASRRAGFLSLYSATADRAWLARAREAADFILARLRREGRPGLATAVPSGPEDDPLPQREENVQAARFANLLFHYTGEARFRELADQAIGYFATPEVSRRFNVGGVLLADREWRADPLHVTVVGGRQDPRARELLRAALALPDAYKRVELWDPREGPLPRADVSYPQLTRPAAFLCSEGRCSAPVYAAADLRKSLARATGAGS